MTAAWDRRTPSTGRRPGGLHILVVDDDPEMLEMLNGSLPGIGRIEQCHDAYQALARLENEPFDVVILELLLPGASGVDLIERLDAAGLKVPVVVLSAGGSEGALADRARRAGARAVMDKPVDRRILAFNIAEATRWVNA